MAPPKKSVKMDLGSFLADDSLGGGSWADEEVDMSSIGVSLSAAPVQRYGRDEGGFSSSMGGGDEFRQERKEFPIPDEPPYRVRIGNLPWEASEGALERFFEDRLQLKDIISEVKLPLDTATGRLKGFGFVTFNEREFLEEALNLNLTEFNGRKIFVNVAAPQRPDVFDVDWRAARSGPLSGGGHFSGGDRPRREDPDLDWSSARGSGALPPRERGERGERGEGFDRGDRGDRLERRPRREDPDLDWSSARGSGTLPPRERSNRTDRPERRPKKDEPDLDWGSARSAHVSLPPRERSNRVDRPERRPKKDEPDLDWSSARGSALPPRQPSHRKGKKPEADLDWSKRTSSDAPAKKNIKKEEPEKKDSPKPQKSSYDVLAVEGESDDESNAVEQSTEDPKPEEKSLEENVNKLSIDDSKEAEGWNVVGK